MTVKLYSTNCPKCKVLETKLKQMNIGFEVITDMEKVMETAHNAGILSAPILQVDNDFMDFTKAIKYLKEIVS